MADVKAPDDRLLERGDIYFLYRPRVDTEHVHGLKDVERFYILLKPWRPPRYRLIIIGRKRLPDPKEHNRFWGFVWRVFKDRAELNQELGAQEYVTETGSSPCAARLAGGRGHLRDRAPWQPHAPRLCH